MVVQSYENFCGEGDVSVSKCDEDDMEDIDDLEIDDHDIKAIFPDADLDVSNPC